MHLTVCKFRIFMIASYEKAMRLINRAMGECEIYAFNRVHAGYNTGRCERDRVEVWENSNAELFDNGMDENRFQGDCARTEKEILAALEWSWRFAHAPHLSHSHRNLHLLTRFYCALKLPQLPSNKAEGSLLMHNMLDNWNKVYQYINK